MVPPDLVHLYPHLAFQCRTISVSDYVTAAVSPCRRTSSCLLAVVYETAFLEVRPRCCRVHTLYNHLLILFTMVQCSTKWMHTLVP